MTLIELIHTDKCIFNYSIYHKYRRYCMFRAKYASTARCDDEVVVLYLHGWL